MEKSRWERLRLFFDTKSPACAGVGKFYLSLLILLVVVSGCSVLLSRLGFGHFLADRTLLLVTALFVISFALIYLTPSHEPYRSMSEKFRTYRKVKKYITSAYWFYAIELLMRLLGDEGFVVMLASIIGYLAIILAFWFALSALIVYWLHHDVAATHKACVAKFGRK